MNTGTDPLASRYALNRHRLKGVGGSTLHWLGRINRLMPSDFRTASTYGLGTDWPISYDELEPYYSQAEWEIGVSGEQHPSMPPRSRDFPLPGFPLGFNERFWLPIAEKLAIPLYLTPHAVNTRPYGGRSRCMAYVSCELCPSGARYSADFHIQEVIDSGTCDLLTETVARRIDVSPSGEVRAIHATTLGGQDLEIRARRYVIAAHAVESARLLLLSNVGNHSDQVGRNFFEHIYVVSNGRISNQRFYPYRTGVERLESLGFYDGAERESRGGIKLEFSFLRDPLVEKKSIDVWGKELARYDHEQFGHEVIVAAETEQQPNPDSRITLDASVRDLFGDPVPSVHLAFGATDRKTQARAREIVSELLEAAGATDIVHEELAFGSHHMGTCRMSEDPNQGVVDRHCKVHGTANLYVVGSSVFPTGGALQPTATVAALSLRLAAHLLDA